MTMYRAITKRDTERFNLAKMIAQESLCRYKLGAVICQGSTVISLACNVIKSHPDHKRYYGDHCISIHAEHGAILRARSSVVGATMYVARYGDMERYTSKPCPACHVYMELAGIACMVYEVSGVLVKEVL